MGQVTRKERRRLREVRKRKEASRRRHGEDCFFGAFRRAMAGGWVGCEPRRFEDEEELRVRVTGLCEAANTRPGSSDAWHLLAGLLEQYDAPLDVILAVAHSWMRSYPTDPRSHGYRVKSLLSWGLKERALRAIEEARASPAGASLEAICRRLASELGVDVVVDLARRERKAHPTPLPAAARGGGVKKKLPGRPEGARSRSAAGGNGEQQPPSHAKGGSEAAPPAPVKVSFITEPDDLALKRLLSGPHDGRAALNLARRGAEILAVDRYDRLLALAGVRGVNHLSYQIETVLRVLKRFRGRVLLADEVGLGKTIEACLVLKEYLVRGQARRALILVPAALVGQWKSELEEKFAIRALTTQDPLFRKEPEAFWRDGPVLVVSLALARNPAHCACLFRQEFDLVIVDEAHHLKNRATRGWEVVNGLRSRFFLMLTATPVETNLKELYNLVTLLRPGTLGTEDEFRRRFVCAKNPTEPRDAQQLRELLQEVMIRNTRARCGVLLPPRTARTLIVRPAAEEAALYRLVVEAARWCEAEGRQEHRPLFRQLLEEGGSSPLAVAATAARVASDGADPILRARLAAIDEAARGVLATAKLGRLLELLPGGKALVFSRFRATLEQIALELTGRGIAFRTFHGGMTAVEKDLAVEAFAQTGLDVLLCSEVGGEGRNLQFCHRLINFDLPWNPMKIEQRIGRIHRIGQKQAVEVTNLACAGTAEEKILDVLDRRINLFELVVGEMDLLLGELEREEDFDDQVYGILARSRTEEEVEQGFDELGRKLQQARGKLERTKALDEALFGEDYGL